MGWRVGVTSGCSKYGISHIEQQRKVIYINNLIIFIVFIIFHNVDMYKIVKKYGKTYRKILVKGNYPDPDVKQEAYEKRLAEMYASKRYAEHNIYPTTNSEYIYAIIDMCLELKEFGL